MTPRHRPSVGSSQRLASATGREDLHPERRADAGQDARHPAQAEADDRDRPGRDRWQDRPEGQGQRQQHERLADQERDRQRRVGRPVAADERRDRDGQQPRCGRVRRDDDRRAEPATEQQVGAAERPGEDRVGDAALEVAADRRGADERGGHRQHEAEHERDQDQHLRDADLDLDRLGAALAGQRDEAVQAPADERDREQTSGWPAPRRPAVGRVP